MDLAEQLRTLAKEAAIRSVPKLLKTAASEGLKVTRKQAEEALEERVPRQVLAPPPRSNGKVFSESPESRYACDLIDFSQNTSNPGYILVLCQTWSRRLWCAPMQEKTAEQTNAAMKTLLDEAKPKTDQTHVLLHDAGQEFSQLSRALPGNWVSTVKDPLDRQGIASLDKAIQTLKQNLEDRIEEDGGDWRTQLKAAVAAYNRSYNSAVLGPPDKAENGASRQFLIEQTNAQNMAHDGNLAKKRVEAVQKTEHFREATGNKRGFNPQYSQKLHLEEVIPGGQYIKGSDDHLHLLKRVIPVHPNSGEPQGKLTQPRQYLHDTLQDLAEDLYSELVGHPTPLEDVAEKLRPKLQERGAKIKTRDFIAKYTNLFKLVGDVVHALVISNPARTRKASEVEVKPVAKQGPKEKQDMSHEGSVQARQFAGGVQRPANLLAAPSRSSYLAAHFKGETSHQPKTTEAPRRERKTAAEAAQALREAGRRQRIETAAQKEIDKQRRQLDRMIKRG